MSSGLAWVDGASGFIGSHLTAHLRAVGWEVEEASVRVGRPIALPHGATVFHLAGLAHDAGADPQGLMRANRDLALAVYEAAVAAEARAFVHVSSAAVLGGGRDDPADENAPMRPQGAYATSKAEAEAALRQSQGRVPIAIARPPLVYGPGVKANFLRLLQWLTKRRPVPGIAGAGRRSLVSIANLTHALETIGRATPTQARCRIWHVRDGEDVTFDELCRLLGEGLDAPARIWPVPAWVAALGLALVRVGSGSSPFDALRLDDTALRREIHWEPSESLAEGLGAVARWHLSTAGDR